MLQKKLRPLQWLSLFILFIGIAIVQYNNATGKTESVESENQSQFIGEGVFE